jgi:hypothetical protein
MLVGNRAEAEDVARRDDAIRKIAPDWDADRAQITVNGRSGTTCARIVCENLPRFCSMRLKNRVIRAPAAR